MNLEAVTVCCGYSDFLEETIPYNFPHFDKWVIVTCPADVQTQEVCRRHSLSCLVTDEVHRNRDPFNKGRAIIRGLDHLTSDGWVLHLDADIVLPHCARHMMEDAHLQEDTLYGCDRVMVHSWEQWQGLKFSGWLQHDYHHRVKFPHGYQVGDRWASHQYGYVPIGFFQLWHSRSDLYNGIHRKPYPHRHGDAARGDIQFGIQFDRRQRQLIPELLVVHLDSEASPLGKNWQGRKTRRFGPPAKPSPSHGKK